MIEPNSAELAEPRSEYLDEPAAVAYTGATTHRLQTDRKAGRVAYIRIGRAIRYRRCDLDDYLNAHRVPAGGLS